MTTPHTFEAIHKIDPYVSMYKIASSYLGNINFLREVVNKDKPILLSTGSLLHNSGMATMEEIKKALSYMTTKNIILMHCVSKYPCIDPHYNRIEKLKKFGYPVGLSDHSKILKVPKGLPVYEKHIMLEGEDCPDKGVSLTPIEFKEMVEWLKSS
jgi:sialic acid synthase SpsE